MLTCQMTEAVKPLDPSWHHPQAPTQFLLPSIRVIAVKATK